MFFFFFFDSVSQFSLKCVFIIHKTEIYKTNIKKHIFKEDETQKKKTKLNNVLYFFFNELANLYPQFNKKLKTNWKKIQKRTFVHEWESVDNTTTRTTKISHVISLLLLLLLLYYMKINRVLFKARETNKTAQYKFTKMTRTDEEKKVRCVWLFFFIFCLKEGNLTTKKKKKRKKTMKIKQSRVDSLCDGILLLNQRNIANLRVERVQGQVEEGNENFLCFLFLCCLGHKI